METDKKICILGATGHIAKGLIYEFLKRYEYELLLFTRSPKKLIEFLTQNSLYKEIKILTYDDFYNYRYDVILNCIGVGDPQKLKEMDKEIIRLTEDFDNMIIDYLKIHEDTLFVNLSSGAVYGTTFNIPVNGMTKAVLDINDISTSNYYGVSKIYSELKHRANRDFNIVDLRIFSYFSRFIDINAKFFICDIIRSVINNEVFITNNANINRDYINSYDLYSIIESCMKIHSLNNVFDIYSAKYVSKFEILDYFAINYKLKYEFNSQSDLTTITGAKTNYFSENRRLEAIGYIPKYSSTDTIIQETKFLLG